MIKKIFLYLIIFTIPYTLLADPGKPERIYDIKTSIKDGLNNSNELLFTKQEIHLNSNRVKEARSVLYPYLDINTNVSKFSVDDLYALSPELGSTILRPTDTRIDNYYAARISLKKTIYTGGRALSTLRLARAYLERAKSQYQAIHNTVIFDITKAFHTLLVQQEKERIFKDILIELEHIQPLQKKKSSKPINAIRFYNLLAELDSHIAEYSRDTERAKMLFIKTLNIELDARISIKGELKEKTFNEDITLSKCLSWANQYRPEVKQRQFQEEIDALAVSLSMAERYPTVLFGASYEFNGYDLPLDSENWNATLSLNFPIFDGWAGWARVRQKRAQRKQGRYKKALLKDEVHMEVRLAFSDFMFWQKQIAPRKERLAKSKGLFAALEKDYVKGKISSAEFLEVLIGIAEIETRFLEAVEEELVAYAALEKAIGKAFREK